LPFDSRSIVMASSKSRACSPSIRNGRYRPEIGSPANVPFLDRRADATRFLDELPPNARLEY
jgi:hypothetical protein